MGPGCVPRDGRVLGLGQVGGWGSYFTVEALCPSVQKSGMNGPHD